ncbi:MAG: ABC transporter substrate-binding protein [Parvularculaceae bacterium]|nr:ABC transporter substrate-binding protein [Parvularculaceae bacterium]
MKRLLLALLLVAGPAAAGPRVQSADYCADQYVLTLADRTDIAALSPEAAQPFSHLAAVARSAPKARPDVESVAASGAEIVLRTYGGDAAALKRVAAVETLEDANDFDGVKRNIRQTARVLDAEARGNLLIEQLDRRLAALAARPPLAVAALYVTPGGVTAGRGVFVDALFRAAGVANAAAEAGLEGWPSAPLEALVLDPPAMVVTGFFDASTAGADHWSMARHPAWKSVFKDRVVVALPQDLIACPAWFSVEAAERIRDAAERAQ